MNTRTETKTAYRTVPALVIALAALLAGATLAAAQSGVWTNDASGSWSDTANWLNGVVADGTDATADFSQVDVTAPRTVTVDASHVIGSLLFGDSAGVNVDNWTLTPSGGSALTLAVSAGSPTITVNNNAAATNTAWIGVPLAGTTGMTKAGAGMLVLGAENTYSGATAVSAGTLKLTNAAASGTGPVLYLSFDNVNGGIVTNGGSGGSMMNGILVGSGLNVLPGAAPNGRAALSVSNNAVNGGYVLVNSSVVPLNNSGTWSVGMWMKTSTTGAVYAYQGDGGWGNGNTTFHLNGGTNDQAGAFAGGVRWGQGWETGTSNLTDGNWHFVVMTCANGTRTSYVDGNVDAWMVINGNTMNQWSGNGAGGQLWLGGTADLADGDMPLNGEIAEVYVYNRALSQAEVQGLMTAVGPSPQPSILPVSAVSVAAGSKLDLDGVSATVAGLTGSGAVDSTLAGGSATLTIDSSSNPTFAGLITNSVGIVNVIVNGTGALTLAGANGYAGNTWLANGTLDVNAPAALGAGTGGRLLIGGGALDNTSGATVTLSANKPQTWYGDFTFNGTTNLNLGSGAVTLSGPGSTRLVTVDSNLFAVGPLNTYVAGMGLTKAGAGTLLLGGSGASGMQGLLTIAGGTVQMAQDINSIPGLSGTGTLETSGTGVNKWLWINGSTNSTFSGALINYPGTTGRGMGLNKNGTGALTLNGTVTINDTITVQNGALNLAGNGVAITNYNASGDVLSIGTLAGGRAVLTLSGGATLLANYTPAPPYTSSANIGTSATASGSLQNHGGIFNSARQLAIGPTGYGAFSQTAGTATVGGFIACGGNPGGGVINLGGGTLDFFGLSGDGATIGYGSTTTHGVLNVFGTGVYSATGPGGVWTGEVGTGVLNVWGNGVLSVANDGIYLGKGNAGANGTVNLLGGVVAASFITNGPGAGTFNFNGGTLRATNASANPFTTGTAANTTFRVYSGGATIDDGGNTMVFSQPIQAAAGDGVISIPVAAGGSNYIDTPVVTISGGSGSGATAIAQIDYSAGTVTNLMMTCPGTGYSSGDALTVSFSGGGGGGALAGSPTFAANGAGGLAKLGSGSLTLSSGNGFAGAVMVLGGTLNLNPATLNAPADLVISNGTAAIDVSGGSSFNAGNVTLQNNATVSLAYGNLAANPSYPALNASGSLLAPGANITISVSALGLKAGTFTLIKYTGTPLASLANFTLSLPPGLAATLVNNTGNDSIDLNVTTSPQALTWYGGVNNNWDISTTLNWNNGAAYYQQYTNGAVIIGDAVTFDDTLFNQQNTNVNLTAGIYAYPVVVDSTLPYSFTGAGTIAGAGYLVKSNTGSLFIGTSNSYSGGTFIYDGTVAITNDSALGAVSGGLTLAGGALELDNNVTNSRAISVTANSTLSLLPGLNSQLGGLITGAGRLTANASNSTVVLAGTMSNATTIAAGTVRVPSGGKLATAGAIIVGNTNSTGVLNVTGGSVFADNNGGQFTPSIAAGSTAGSAGSIQVGSGIFLTSQQIGLGAGQGGYASLDVSGGTVGVGSYIVAGWGGDTAVLNQSGGTLSVLTNCLTIGAGNTNSVGVATFSGGAFFSMNSTNGNSGGRGGAFVGENGTGTMNVMGTASVNLFGDANLVLGRTGTGSAGTVNLVGGALATAQVSKGAGSGTFNFNGGLLKALTNNASFMSGLSSANVYSGGARIDDGGFNVTAAQPLLAPTGYGVSTISMASGGAGYIDAPVVTITGGSGSGATAIATVSGGAVTGFTVTCPGTGYSSGDSLAVTITGGGGSGAAANTPLLAANVGGNLVKQGAGTLTLGGADNYTGYTLVSTGGLFVTPAHQVTGAVTNANNATFGVLVNGAGTATIGNLTLGTIATGTNYLAMTLATGTNPAAPVLQAGTLTLTGTNWVKLSGVLTAGIFPALQYSGAMAGSGQFNTNVLAPQGVAATLSNDVAHSTLYVVVNSTGPGLVWTGNNSAPALTNLWQNGVTNWSLGAGAVAYTEIAPPGDAVTFSDAGSGMVLLSNTVDPASIVISNSAVNYSFQGSGHISGITGLLKAGAGTATLNLAGDSYSGNTVVSNGVLQVGNTTAIPSGTGAGNVVIGSGASLDLNGLSPAVNGLSGSGIVNNSSATAVALTFGTASTGDTVWAGSITNTGSGGVSFTKVGTNTVTFSGYNRIAGSAASQVNGGTLVLTNGASVVSPSGEFWIQQNAGTGTVVVAGGNLIVSNNWLVIGRNNAAANGTLIVNSGMVRKAGANNIVVGSLGATGKLVVNGGEVLNSGNLWIGENASAYAEVDLNGGLLQATQIRPNSSSATGGTPSGSYLYLNGGTLQASAANGLFISNVTVFVENGGVIDDGGFDISSVVPLWQPPTGATADLVKSGSGTLYLDGDNTLAAWPYSSTTLVVSNGTLAGTGRLTGPITVAPNGNISAGDSGGIGTLNFDNSSVGTTLTLQGRATFRISKTGGSPSADLINGVGAINYGGTLVISNVTTDATPLTTSDTFQLFSAGSSSGNFISIAGSPGPGLAYSFDPATGVLGIVSAATPVPVITGIGISGTTLNITATNGAAGGAYVLLDSTNLALPLSQWTPVLTNTFDINGNLNLSTNVLDPSIPQEFYLLQQ